MKTDLHAHHVPAALWPAAKAGAERHGARVLETPEGTLLSFGEGERTRPPEAKLTDLDGHRRFLAEQGIERQVLSTWIDLHGYGLPPEQAHRWSQLINRTLAESIAGDPRFLGFCNVPLQDAGRAAEVAEEAVRQQGLAGVQLSTGIGGKGLDGPELDPFWRQIEALRAPIILHPVNLRPSERVRRYARPWLVENPFETVLAASELIYGGVIDRFPDLRVMLCHGGGYLPYQIGRVQKGYELQAALRERLARTPREYLRWFYYDTVLSQPEPLRLLLELVGPERVVLGSDYPYGFGDLTPARSLAAAGLGPRELEQVTSLTPARLLGPA